MAISAASLPETPIMADFLNIFRLIEMENVVISVILNSLDLTTKRRAFSAF